MLSHNHLNTAPEDLLANFLMQPLVPAFDPSTIEFIDELRKSLSHIKPTDEVDEGALLSLLFWLRPGNIKALAGSVSVTPGVSIRPLGTLLLMAPSNVATFFVYISVLGLLLGNRVAVRVSSRQNPLVKNILDIIGKLSNSSRFSLVGKRWFLFSGNHNDAVVTTLSYACHLRSIWGGDLAIQSIRNNKLGADAREFVFPDRISVCYIRAGKAFEEQLVTYATRFAGELIALNQQGCNSPRAVIWERVARVEELREMFWHAVIDVLDEKVKPFSSIEQSICLQALSMQLDKARIQMTSPLGRVEVELTGNLLTTIRKTHLGHGVIVETFVDKPEDMLALETHRLQTLAVAGMDAKELLFSEVEITPGFERIVPFGGSSQFDVIWDGVNLLQAFSRVWRRSI